MTERTREIGIRWALEAKKRDIAAKFWVETLVSTILRGLIGIVVGLALAYVLANSTFGIPTLVRWWSPTLAFAVSMLVGIISGNYPAIRAANLDPIDALRHS